VASRFEILNPGYYYGRGGCGDRYEPLAAPAPQEASEAGEDSDPRERAMGAAWAITASTITGAVYFFTVSPSASPRTDATRFLI